MFTSDSRGALTEQLLAEVERQLTARALADFSVLAFDGSYKYALGILYEVAHGQGSARVLRSRGG